MLPCWGGIIQKVIFVSAQSPPLPEISQRLGAKSGNDSVLDLSKNPLAQKISFEFCTPITKLPQNPILLLQRSQTPQLRPYLRGISTPCMGHFILPSAAMEKKKEKRWILKRPSTEKSR